MSGYLCLLFTLLILAATDANQAESTGCECENTSGIIGGVVVTVVLIVTTALTVIVIVVLVLRSRRGNYSTSTAKMRLFKVSYFTHVIVLFTEMQLVLQISHWSSPSSQRQQRQLMRKCVKSIGVCSFLYHIDI